MGSANTTSTTTEVIVFSSGKGGTGKTSLISALGYALSYSGHKVLLIDADRATDGLSLFVLGPHGMNQLGDYKPENTFLGILEHFERTQQVDVQPRIVHRLGSNDHDLSYNAIISGQGLYGDRASGGEPEAVGAESWNRQFERTTFRRAVSELFRELRERHEYDYVLVDSRGGFSFESTDVAAAADSFVLVTEATYTNFYQDRNLVNRINTSAAELDTKSLLRGIIVNKSTEPPEMSFRQELTKEFGVRLEDTFAVAWDAEAAAAYKTQKAIYRTAPACRFAYDSLQAFHQILKVVTAQWPDERARRWNELIATVDAAIRTHNEEVERERNLQASQLAHVGELESENQRMSAELVTLRQAHEQETKRQDTLLDEIRKQAKQREEAIASDRERDQERMRFELTVHEREVARLSGQVQEAKTQLAEVTDQLRDAQERVQRAQQGAFAAEHAVELKQSEMSGRIRLYLAMAAMAVVLVAAGGVVAYMQKAASLDAEKRSHVEDGVRLTEQIQTLTQQLDECKGRVPSAMPQGK